MIVDTVAGVVLGLLRGLVELIPVWSPPAEITSPTWLDELGDAVSFANAYVPVGDILLAIGVLLAIRAILMLWHVIVWVYDRIPFKAS